MELVFEFTQYAYYAVAALTLPASRGRTSPCERAVRADTLRVKAFVDWDDVYVMPFAAAVHLPDDIVLGPIELPLARRGRLPERGCAADI